MLPQAFRNLKIFWDWTKNESLQDLNQPKDLATIKVKLMMAEGKKVKIYSLSATDAVSNVVALTQPLHQHSQL